MAINVVTRGGHYEDINADNDNEAMKYLLYLSMGLEVILKAGLPLGEF